MTDHDKHETEPDGASPERADRAAQERADRTDRAAAGARMAEQHLLVDQQIRLAMERGEFDDLPGKGKPIKNLGATHDPDWWLKQLVEREQITVLPPSLELRKEDTELDACLDKLAFEAEVRRVLVDFNERVVRARYSLSPGPPLVTMPRDVEESVAAWAVRRLARRDAAAAARAAEDPDRKRRWWSRRR